MRVQGDLPLLIVILDIAFLHLAVILKGVLISLISNALLRWAGLKLFRLRYIAKEKEIYDAQMVAACATGAVICRQRNVRIKAECQWRGLVQRQQLVHFAKIQMLAVRAYPALGDLRGDGQSITRRT